MKIRILTTIAGDGYTYNVGDEVDMDDKKTAEGLIEHGFAEPVEEAPKKGKKR